MKRHGNDTVRFHTLPHMKAIQVVWGYGVKNTFPRHTHRMVCLGIVDNGKRVISQKGAETVVPEGCLFVLNAEESHACGPREKEGHSYRVICVEPDFLRSIASQIAEKDQSVPHFRAAGISDNEIARLIHQFFSLLEPGSPALQQQSCVLSLFSRLVMRHAADAPVPCRIGPAHAAVDRVREYIERHFAENLSLEALALIACLSPFHFQRVFLSHRGVSPHEYLIQFRLRKAREFLRNGLSITDTALDTGFVDQSHFTRFFKRGVGIAPGQYVRLCHRESHPGLRA